MKRLPRCDRCGSAGSIEFDMCQVCYKDYSGYPRGEIETNRLMQQIEAMDAGPFRDRPSPARFEPSLKGCAKVR